MARLQIDASGIEVKDWSGDSDAFTIVPPDGAEVTLQAPDTDGIIAISVNDFTTSVKGNVNLDYTVVTKAQADALVGSSTLRPSRIYKIIGVDVPLYGGTDILIEANSSTTFFSHAAGLFYNPIYNQALATQGIWSNLSTFVASSIVGTFNANELITADNGATGQLYTSINNGKFIALTGDWASAVSITGNVSLATANVASISVISYAIGSTVIWGGKVWENVNGNVGAATNSLTLNAEWTVIPYNTTDYDLIVDEILYDYDNDQIIKRVDREGNIVVATPDDRSYFTAKSLVGYPISVFQWGNPHNRTTNRGTAGNQILNSYAESVNNAGEFMSNTLTGRSIIAGNSTINSRISFNRLGDFAEIRNNLMSTAIIGGNTLSGGGLTTSLIVNAISGNSLATSDIKENTLDGRCTISSNAGYQLYIHFNKLRYICNINSNISYDLGLIMNNELQDNCTINSNTVTGTSYMHDNKLLNNCKIDSNVLSPFGQILNNELKSFAYIRSNTLAGTSASNSATIANNKMQTGEMNLNSLVGARADISNNEMRAAIGYTDTPGRSNIYSNTIAATSRIEHCILEADSNIYNVTTAPGFRLIHADLYANDINLNNVTLTRDIEGIRMKKTEGFYHHSVTFTGAAGLGAIGAITLPTFYIPSGYFVTEILVDVGAGLTGIGGTVNLGIETDDTDAILNNTTGTVANLNSNVISHIFPSTFVKSTGNRLLVGTVADAAITAGTMNFQFKLSKFI